uniref:MAM domain-containing protein n=1 Tax=Globodera pallida TaxID=36090 RepID=A0A183C0L3_GLOPA
MDRSVITKLVLALLLAVAFYKPIDGYAKEYKRELYYLDFYLGIRPANEQGDLEVEDRSIDKYIESAAQLNCDFRSNCLWTNAPSDGLLDTSEFYMPVCLSHRLTKRAFQVGPGNAHPPTSTHFAFAGNLTKDPQSAVLISAPIASQSSTGILSFEYWLYNSARLEVILLKVNPVRGHLTVIERPITDCHFLKTNGIYSQTVRTISSGGSYLQTARPRGGIFWDDDQSAVRGRAEWIPYRPPIFGGLPTARWLRQRRPIASASNLNCGREDARDEHFEECLWADFAKTPGTNTAHWAIGEHTQHWEQIMRSTPSSRPKGQFYFQYVDPIAEFPLPQLRSVLVPCTQTPSSLSFKFWLSLGLQAQICTLGSDNVALSCVYLNEADAPGPLTIDVDTADHQPFRFAFNVLRIDRGTNGGAAVIVLDDIRYSGWLCHESAPTAPPPLMPPFSSLLQLRLPPTAALVDTSQAFPDSLECDFERGDQCPHWMHSVSDLEIGESEEEAEELPDSQKFWLGLVPRRPPFPVDPSFRGAQVAVALLNRNAPEEQFAILTSRPISCAEKGRLTVAYFASPGAQLSVCANEQCVSPKRRRDADSMSVALNSAQPFRIRIIAELNNSMPIGRSDPYEPFILIKHITARSGFCRLTSAAELACQALSCEFGTEGMCKFKTLFLAAGDVPFVVIPSAEAEGIVARFSRGMRRAILKSHPFRLPSGEQLEMHLEARLSTFGSRLYICPDEQQRTVARLTMEKMGANGAETDPLREFGHCELLLGPKVDERRVERLVVQLDPELRHFSLVAVHDKTEQFGDAEVQLNRIEIRDAGDRPVC